MNDTYEIALSFAGEDRAYVAEVAAALAQAGVRVFYDEYEKATLWGKDLFEHLSAVYLRGSKYTVLFASEHYARKLWPSHERRSAQARALAERQEYILPARFDDTEIPGLLSTIHYIDLRHTTPEELAELCLAKLGRHRQGVTEADRREAGALLIALQSRRGTIGEVVAAALELARRTHSRELERFCQNELLGYSPERVGDDIAKRAFRAVTYFCTAGMLDIDAVGWTGMSVAAAIRQHPEAFVERRFVLTEPITSIETKAKAPNAKGTWVLRTTLGFLNPEVSNPEHPIHCYAAAESFAEAAESIRDELTKLLTRLIQDDGLTEGWS